MDEVVPPGTEPRASRPTGLYQEVFEAAPAAMALLDADLRIVAVNPALGELLLRPPPELVGRHLAELSSSPHPARLALMAEKALTVGGVVAVEHRFSRGDGTEGWARSCLRRVGRGEAEVVLVVVMADMTSEQQALEQQRREAELDPLTGLLNRRGGDRRLRLALSRMAEQGPVAVIVTDADGFKEINDRFGHAAGDEVLLGIAGRLRGALRLGDDVARLGGDEFIVVARVSGEAEAVAVAERCVATVAAPIRSRRSGVLHRVTLSAGVAVAYPDRPVDTEALIEAADRALYRAKAEGGNRCVLVPSPPAGPEAGRPGDGPA